MGFKKIAVLCDVYEMSKGKQISVKDRTGDAILKDRIFGLLDANKRNANYKDKRRWIDIKWQETAVLQLEAGNLDWVDYVLEQKKLECKALKRKIKFPVKDSYTEALEDGEELEKYNDYIEVVEAQIELIESIEFKPKVEEPVDDLSDLKAIIKDEDLKLKVAKTEARDSVVKRIEEARKSK